MKNKKFWRPERIGALLMGFWTVSGAIATVWQGTPVQFLERQTQRLFIELRGPVPAPEDIVILAIDDESLTASERYRHPPDPKKQAVVELLEAPFPWQRSAYAEAIERLMAAGAKSVALDLLFDLPSGYGPEDDRRFKQTLSKYSDRIVLAAAYNDVADPQGIINHELYKPHEEVYPTSVSLGLVNFLAPEVDGRVYQLGSEYIDRVLRRLPSSVEIIPSFAEATLQAAQQQYPSPEGSTIFFYGTPNRHQNVFKTIPFWQVLASDWWDVHLREQTFKDKIVLVGVTADQQGISDFVPTAIDLRMPGIELHAHAIATLLKGRSMAEAIPSPPLRGLFVLVVVTVTAVGLCQLPKKTVALLFWGLGMVVVWGGMAFLLFNSGRLIFPTAIPAIAIALNTLSYFTTLFISDQIEKKRFRNTLERYVGAPVVQEILKQHDEYQQLLRGRKLKAAILFSDIRGFTTLSSQLEPEPLVEQLNIYLNAMVEAILDAGGTVDKFIGDAVMAEFGSPVSEGEKTDAMNAIRAALGMRRALHELRQQWRREGRVPLFNGIGINYGELIAGDIGSLRRREYAVIGDAVNVASRVEGLTKRFGTDILITDPLYQIVKEEVEIIDLGEQEVRGRSGAVQLYSLIGLKGEPLELYEQVHEELQSFLNKGKD
ncbi:MAG TPA: adenylate/guanylate cyclase domain-containing protein [Cyanobacteria bacterium UBA9273]|nr:adenylate/guanylate cyclase domain-containing protein [Cyanobacteria bacterium UBA9273]